MALSTATHVLWAGPQNPDGKTFGSSTTDPISFYGVTPVVQRSGSVQAAVTTTASSTSSPWGFATAAQADGVISLLNEIRATLVQNGMIKGS